MKGIYDIIIKTNKLIYKLQVKRKITIIKGESSTGKSNMISILDFKDTLRNPSIKIESKLPVYIIEDSRHWVEDITDYENSIFIIDEANFVRTKRFAEVVERSDSYFIVITRDSLKNLTYSVDEIYELKNSGKYIFMLKYINSKIDSNLCPDKIIVEDSKSGYQFISRLFGENKCIAAGGNNKIKNFISDTKTKYLILADGAAFGQEIDDILFKSKLHQISYILKESFEYILLESGIFNNKNLNKILEEPWNYIDIKEYLTWELYFYDLIKEISQEVKHLKYSKSNIPEGYFTDKNLPKILKSYNLVEIYNNSCKNFDWE